MSKLRVKYRTEDRDWLDVGCDTFDYPDQDSLLGCVEAHLRKEEEYDDDDWDTVLDMIKTKRWFGGEWYFLSDNHLVYDTDVTEVHYSLV